MHGKPSFYTALGRPRVIAIVGPTASGKSALGVWLAQQLETGLAKLCRGAEVISADSRQVYKGLDIGTGKVTKKEMAGVPHHLLSVANPKKQFSVDDFVRLAEQAHSDILQNVRISIIVGGTGLYVDTFLGRMSYPEVPPNLSLRKRLASKNPAQLFALLQKLDPRRAANIEKDNPRRLVRAIEIAKAIGRSPTKDEAMGNVTHRGVASMKYDVLWLGLNPSATKLKSNVKKRLASRIKAGMVAEAKRLHKAGLSYKRMDELGLEYRYLAQFLQNKITKQGLEQKIERGNLEYAKRQMRWFKRNQSIVWIKNKSEALRLAKEFLRTPVKLTRQ